MTTTLHPNGLEAHSEPGGETVLLVGANHDSVEIEKNVLVAIAMEHAALDASPTGRYVDPHPGAPTPLPEGQLRHDAELDTAEGFRAAALLAAYRRVGIVLAGVQYEPSTGDARETAAEVDRLRRALVHIRSLGDGARYVAGDPLAHYATAALNGATD